MFLQFSRHIKGMKAPDDGDAHSDIVVPTRHLFWKGMRENIISLHSVSRLT